MSRLNIFLLIIVLGCALSVVNATNQQRRLFVQLERAQAEERQLQQDYAQLQYEQSALSKTSRIEQVATDSLKMRSVVSGGTQYLTLAAGASEAKEVAIPSVAASAGVATARAPKARVAAANRGGAR
ncbi:cell division protein FtsL [Paraburkholderia sp. NMBU_R16]|uniref:cell division protein FtsL n=1 Tax=Paraburkholderia sp. NMBU_R16 TaxID=2698676 RepID=UPI001566329A|nr:cell division protein FtsL [Paraburkholderia sp. NMBU_R16]NRO97204.1 cell division protein FtsL [Paraburkholderia sp. NMBU_R16]